MEVWPSLDNTLTTVGNDKAQAASRQEELVSRRPVRQQRHPLHAQDTTKVLFWQYVYRML